MATLVIQHVKTSELPFQWAQQLKVLPGQTVTIRIETEMADTSTSETTTSFVTDDPAFGIWHDYKAAEDVTRFVQDLRAARHNPDASRNED